MKKILALISLSLALVGGASATQYSDVNPADVRLDASAGGYVGFFKPTWVANPLYNPSYTGLFTLAGYDPLAEEITSASVSFKLWDGDFFSESYSLTMSDMSFSGSNFFWYVTLADNVVGNALLGLSSTGELSYTITANSGSFWLKEATLTAESTRRPVAPPSVPETSSTFVLIGAALLGLAGLKRKLRA